MPPEVVTITANGEPHEVPGNSSVERFLAERGLKPTQVVVELNGTVLPRSAVATTLLGNGDRLEIIVPVAGG